MNSHTDYSLQVVGHDDQESATSTASSTCPEDLMRLLILSGQDPRPKTYTLNVSAFDQDQQQDLSVSANKNLTVVTTNADEIARLLQLCGLKSDDVEAECGHEQPASGPEPAPEVAVMEQQAEHDYGHEDPEDEQHEFDIKDYNFKGRADLPERLTNARFGSNALASEMRESIHTKLVAAYQEFLGESQEDEAAVNADGISSPLTANDRNEFDKDPFSDEESDTTGDKSPLSTIVRQHIPQ